MPAIANVHQLTDTLYSKDCSQLLLIHSDSGVAMQIDISISMAKSFDNNFNIEETLAPNTFLIPISLVRCSALNMMRPSKPMQEITMARAEKYLLSLPMMVSLTYNLP